MTNLKTIRGKIYKLLSDKFGVCIGDLKRTDFKILLKKLSPPEESKPILPFDKTPKKNFNKNKQPTIRTWRNEE